MREVAGVVKMVMKESIGIVDSGGGWKGGEELRSLGGGTELTVQ
jgi:hypothetical protein